MKDFARCAVLSGLAAVIALLVLLMARDVDAVGAWTGGQDVYHVPLSWCAVQGSPAAANPNITPLGSTTPDTTTDAVLWRRHERPTDNIYINQTGITFRSAINNAWGTLNFPIIPDPDTTLGQQGDMRGEDVNAFGVEYNQLLTDCDNAWTALGRAGIGVTAINANLFHNATGDYVGVIGWGGCTRSLMTGNCVAPYDGRIVVIDNNYLYPTVADRTFPPSPADPAGNLQFVLTDPLDQLVGHELGHALSLQHRTNAMALMNPGQTDNDGDGQSDNIALNAAEVTQLRTNAQGVPGLETDPPTQFIPGAFVRTRIADQTREHDNLPPYRDLAVVKVTLNKKAAQVHFGAQFFGVIPEVNGARPQVWFLIDSDGKESGIPLNQLKEIGVPETSFAGADLVIRADVAGRGVSGTGWIYQQGRITRLDRVISFDLQRLIMEPHFSPIRGQEPPKIGPAAIHDIVEAVLPAGLAGIMLDKPFVVQVIALEPGQPGVDKLDERVGEPGIHFVLENPSFAHCFVQDEGVAGRTVKIRIEGLRPNRGLHGLLGPQPVFTGVADATGGGVIDFPIPHDARPGVHLVTIGTDDTALTADCALTVKPRVEEERPPLGPREFSLIKSHEDLLKAQQRLLEMLGGVLRELLTTYNLQSEDALRLTRDYQELVRQQTKLLTSFESIVREKTR
jgi:hypothetical protein